MALQVQSAPQGSLCCLTRTASVSSGWSWNLSVCTAVWQISWPTHTPQTWSALRPCCATCSHGLPDASFVGALRPSPFTSLLCSALTMSPSQFLFSRFYQFSKPILFYCEIRLIFIDLIALTGTKSSQTYCSIIAGDINLFYVCIYLFIYSPLEKIL